MKENKFKIFLVVLLLLLAIGITSIMVMALVGKWNVFSYYFNFNINRESKIILEETYNDVDITKITIDGISSDVKVIYSEADEIKVTIYGEEKDKVTSEIVNDTLKVSKNIKNHFCFGFCGWNEDAIIIALPMNMQNKLEINTVSGDINLLDFNQMDIKVKTTSGDVKIGNVADTTINTTSGDIEIYTTNVTSVETVSGEIVIGNINSKANLKTTSGDIDILNIKCEEASNIKSISGDVTIKNVTNAYVEASSTSGDIKIENNDRFAPVNLTIKTTSGDIKIK